MPWPTATLDAGPAIVPGSGNPPPEIRDGGYIDAAADSDANVEPPAPFVLSSPAFSAGGRLPNAHSCVGGATSPALTWSAGPAGTQSYAVALITHNQTFQTEQQTVQWVVWDIHALELPAGVAAGEMPSNVSGARQTNATSSALPLLGTPPSYVAPCVLTGIDSFEFVAYALSEDVLELSSPISPEAIVSELESNSVLSLGRSALPFTFP